MHCQKNNYINKLNYITHMHVIVFAFFVCFFYQVCYLCSILQVLRVATPHSVVFELGNIFLCHIFIKIVVFFSIYISLTFCQYLINLILPPSLDRNRPDQLSDEAQRRYAEEVQAMQAAEVAKQLEDFR